MKQFRQMYRSGKVDYNVIEMHMYNNNNNKSNLYSAIRH